MTYQTHHWSDLDEQMQAFVISLHAASWNVEQNRTADLYKIFHQGNPAIVFDSLKKYCRIDTSHVEEMKMLIRQYLQ